MLLDIIISFAETPALCGLIFRPSCVYLKTFPEISIFCALSGYLFYSSFTVASRYTSSIVFFWLTLGIGQATFCNSLNVKTSFSFTNWLKVKKKTQMVYLSMIVILFFGAAKATVEHYISDVYLKKAYETANKNNYPLALKFLNKSIRLNPKSVEAYYDRGFVYFNKNMFFLGWY